MGFPTTRVCSAMIGKPMIDLKNINMTGYISEAIASSCIKANGMKWGEVVLYNIITHTACLLLHADIEKMC